MKGKLRPRLATVISALALFVALGGTSAALTGGTQYSPHQIRRSTLEDRSVSGAKLENHTVTAEQLNITDLPTVPSATVAGDASLATSAETARTATTAKTITGTISGSQVSSAVANATSAENANTAATAGTITGTISGSQVSGAVAHATSATSATNAITATSATTATTATTATNATNATNATSATDVDGDELSNVSVWSGSSSDSTLVHTLAGLTLAMRCTGGDVDIDATTSVADAALGMSDVTNAAATSFTKAEGNFNPGSTITITSTAPGQVDLSYDQNGEVASGTLTVFDDSGTCAAFGVIESSN